MKRVMLKVAYDGTEYCGWQIQPNGITIEEVLNRELTRITGAPVAVIGASRTDSGVHARGNVCVFDTESRIPAEKFAFAINAGLPQDVVVQSSCEVAGDFHPRHCDCHKTYEYRICNATFPDPLVHRYSHFLYHKLDVDAMREAAQYLIGEHDFKSFCSVNTQVKDTVRKVNSIELLVEPRDGGEARMITIRINGNGFLYNMVRIIAGTLIQVGFHRYPPEHVKEILEAKDRAAAGETAPACGLTLMEICYREEDYQKCREELAD